MIGVRQEDEVAASEKAMNALHVAYAQAMRLLKQGKLEEGVEHLRGILQDRLIDDPDLSTLKFSAHMSIAQARQAQNDSLQALGAYWQALKIAQRKGAQLTEKSHLSLAQLNEERGDEEFTILLKMIHIIEELEGMSEQYQYLLKRAITVSPRLWRQKLLLQIRASYEKEGQTEAIQDLDSLMENREQLEGILMQNLRQQYSEEAMQEQPGAQQGATSHNLDDYWLKIQIPLTLAGQESKTRYSNWELLLAVSYVLLKCQAERGFSRKKYLHRYDQTNNEWNEFLAKFHPLYTNLLFSLKQQNIERMEEVDDNSHETPIVEQLTIDILKNEHSKKRGKKHNPIEDVLKLPNLSGKEVKKGSLIQAKSVFASLNEYFKDQFDKAGFRKDDLSLLKVLQEESFNDILKVVVHEEPQSKAEIQDEDQDMQVSQPQHPGSDKPKKTLKQVKSELLAQNTQLIHSFSSFTSSSISIQFINTVDMVEKITAFLIKEKLSDQALCTLKSLPVRKVLQKSILKVIMMGEGFFDEFYSTSHPEYIPQKSLLFLELLIEKLEQLIDKQNSKNKPFKSHQQNKKKFLFKFIEEHYMPSSYQIMEVQSRQMTDWEINYYTTVCQTFVKMHSMHGFINQAQIQFYKELFIYFKTKKEAESHFDKDLKEIGKKVRANIERDIQKWHKKACLQASMQASQEADQNTSIQQAFKKDQDISSALMLLKLFNISESGKQIKPSESSEALSGRSYLQAFSKITEIFFSKVQGSSSAKEFNSRALTLVADVIPLKAMIGDMYERLTHIGSVNTADVDARTWGQALFSLLKLYLSNIDSDSDHSIRIMFFLTTRLLRAHSEEDKLILVPKLVCLFDELIKFKKFKGDALYTIRKRLYLNFILKHLTQIYNSPVFAPVPAKRNKKKALSRQNSSRSDSSEAEVSDQPEMMECEDKYQDVREQVYDILHDVYFCPQRDKQFNPKKMEEVLGYFMYLSKAHHEAFQCKVVELEGQVAKIIKKCYKIYQEKRSEIYTYSEQFLKFEKAFESYMNGDDSEPTKDLVLSVIQGKRKICETFVNLAETNPFYMESLFVLGKFFESQSTTSEASQEQNRDQKFYFEYLCSNFNSTTAWQNLIRVNCNKTYLYFDSLVGQPLDQYRKHFLYTKKILITVAESFPHLPSLVQYANQRLIILNALKIKEREYMALLSGMEKASDSREQKDSAKKYREGLSRIYTAVSTKKQEDLKVKYLQLMELKTVWYDIESDESLEDKIKGTIEIGDIEVSSSVIHQPSQGVIRLQEIIHEARQVIGVLRAEDKKDYVIHLEEDLVMQVYCRASRSIAQNIDSLASCLIISAIQKTQDKTSVVEEAQYHMSQLNSIVNTVLDSDLALSPKYKLQQSHLQADEEELKQTEVMIKTFANSVSSLALPALDTIKKMSSKTKRENYLMIDEKEEEGSERANSADRAQSVRSGQSRMSKQEMKKKVIKFDLIKYILMKMKADVTAKQLQSSPTVKKMLQSPQFIKIGLRTSRLFTQMCRIGVSLPSLQTKRFKNRRSVCLTLMNWSHMALKYNGDPSRAYEMVKEYMNSKNDEICCVNMSKDRVGTEKNQVLSEYYHRALYHHIFKIKFVRHVLSLLEEQGNKDALVLLIRKLIKLSNSKPADSGKVADKNKEKKTANKEEMEAEPPVEAKNPPKNKEKEQKYSINKYMFLLFSEAVNKFINIIRRQSADQPVQDKYEKNLLEFRNRLRKNSFIKEEDNQCWMKMCKLINDYEVKFNKKIKMKTYKKKEDEEAKKDQDGVEDIGKAEMKPEMKPENMVDLSEAQIQIIAPDSKIKNRIKEIIEAPQVKSKSPHNSSNHSQEKDVKKTPKERKVKKTSKHPKEQQQADKVKPDDTFIIIKSKKKKGEAGKEEERKEFPKPQQ